MDIPGNDKPAAEQALLMLKHDVKNQLSNINLALGQLKYELENPTDDCVFYMDTIATSCAKINSMIENAR
jgi:nitrogen fixation/metabolism regulation signal transduction histidine kinase